MATEIIVAAEVYHGDYGDTTTIEDTDLTAQVHLDSAETECETMEVVADKGNHSEDSLDRLQNKSNRRTYIPEPHPETNRKWKNNPPEVHAAHRRNRRNTAGAIGRDRQRLRSQRMDRISATRAAQVEPGFSTSTRCGSVTSWRRRLSIWGGSCDCCWELASQGTWQCLPRGISFHCFSRQLSMSSCNYAAQPRERASM
ncbi:MAG: hypothetical protein AAF961_13690 [Planctomycetota bacterium]